eukprot:m.208425 g.208425  ORF g.208425 m.208425 type:complete len:456 (-) comp33006_c0_seq1:118-1485(-)
MQPTTRLDLTMVETVGLSLAVMIAVLSVDTVSSLPTATALLEHQPLLNSSCKLYGCQYEWKPDQLCQCYAGCTTLQTCCTDYKPTCDPGPPPPPGPGKPGHVVWRSTEMGPGTSARAIDNEPPVIADGTVYFISAAQLWTIYALDAKTGMEKWSASAGLNTSSATAVTVANGSLFYVSAIYAATGSFGTPRLTALNATTGQPRWHLELGPGSLEDRPTVADGLLYIVLGAAYTQDPTPPHTLFAIHADYGRVLWSTNVSGTASQPSVAEGVVYVTASNNGVYAYNATTGVALWFTPDVSNQWSTPTVAEGLLYTSQEQGVLHALDALTGAIVWNTTFNGYNAMGPTYYNGVLFLAGAFNTLYAITAKTGKQVWNHTQLCPGHLWSTPAVTAHSVYVGSDADGVLHVLDTLTGKSQWNFTADDAVRSPVVDDGMVYFGVNSPMSPGSIDQMYVLLA